MGRKEFYHPLVSMLAVEGFFIWSRLSTSSIPSDLRMRVYGKHADVAFWISLINPRNKMIKCHSLYEIYQVMSGSTIIEQLSM